MLRKERKDDCMVAMSGNLKKKVGRPGERIQAREVDQLGRSQGCSRRKTGLVGERKL